MKPIGERVDATYMQALRCVEYRIPHHNELKRSGVILALALRYGLVAAAATNHLFLTAEIGEEADILALIPLWPRMVEDHVRWEIAHRLPKESSSTTPSFVGRMAQKPLTNCLQLFRHSSALDEALQGAIDDYVSLHASAIQEGWLWFKKRQSLREFRRVADESRSFALNFFDRRQADLEELPEIALIGE